MLSESARLLTFSPDASPAADPTERVESKPVFTEYILKVHSRCNLACDYCFMYEHADQSWRNQPKIMARETLVQTAVRIAEHTEGASNVNVILHGGEPLLAEKADPDYYPWATAMFRNILGKHVTFSMQTNGTLFSRPLLDKMAKLGISMGISIDGLQRSHDAHRKYGNGSGSFAQVNRGIKMLAERERQKRDGLYGGLLNVINLEADPLHTYRLLGQHAYRAPKIDFLLPLAHWDMPPPRYTADRTRTPYADWLIPIFDEYRSKKPEHKIRFFDAITALALGKKSNVEYLGLSPPSNVVVETNGEIQQVDALKTVAEGEPALGLNVFEHTFDDAMAHPKTVQRRLGFSALSKECQRCDLVAICGGGYQGERYSADKGYDNPSVYHPDLVKLITHIRDNTQTRLRKAALDSLAHNVYSP